MSKSPYDMTHINYKNLRERMSETSKGFWKVQSIHKITEKLKNRYNQKDYIILKTIKKPPIKTPPFILFEHEEKNQKMKKKLENQKNNSCGRLTVKNFFITSEKTNKKKLLEQSEKAKILYNKIYGSFSYEPYLYNEFQFLSLQKERLLPRKFNDVIKDCMALREYKNFINNMKKTKDENNMTLEKKDNSKRKSMTVISTRNIRKNFLGNFIDETSLGSDINNNKDLNKSNNLIRHNKCFSMKNIRNMKQMQRGTANKIIRNFPPININSKIKMNNPKTFYKKILK